MEKRTVAEMAKLLDAALAEAAPEGIVVQKAAADEAVCRCSSTSLVSLLVSIFPLLILGPVKRMSGWCVSHSAPCGSLWT